jgi:alpha-1,2-mannosyltransferase
MLRGARATTRAVRTGVPYVAVGLVALFARLFPVLRGGGLRGVGGYDDGVYFAAAEAVVHGRVPYRDFMLLHPPALIYLLTPFAALARWVGDADAWAVARVFVMLVGATSAVLVAVTLTSYGRVAALTGGLLYAVWFPALNAEFSTLLEGPANAMLLVALPLLTRGRRPAGNRPATSRLAELLAGAMLGLAAATKIWGVVPLLLVVGWRLTSGGRRSAGRVLAGGVAAIVVVCGPTFVLAPRQMWNLVVRDQIQRSGTHTSLLLRAANMTPVARVVPSASTGLTVAAVVAVGAVGLWCAWRAWTRPSARIFVVLLLAQTVVLLASPSYFPHYGDFVAPAIALTTGVAVAVQREHLRSAGPFTRRSLAAAAFLVVAGLAIPALVVPRMEPFDGPAVQAALSGRRCVEADTPSALILADTLSSDLDRGCPARVDVTGATYNVDRVVGPGGRPVARPDNPLWQHDLLSYLRSGQAAVVARVGSDGLSLGTRRELHRLPVLYRDRHVVVYATG